MCQWSSRILESIPKVKFCLYVNSIIYIQIQILILLWYYQDYWSWRSAEVGQSPSGQLLLLSKIAVTLCCLKAVLQDGSLKKNGKYSPEKANLDNLNEQTIPFQRCVFF